MASLLVVIELVDERPRPSSLELLGQARRIGTEVGATVYAVAACSAPPGYGDDDLIAVLSRHGADKVLIATSPTHAGPMRWGTHGASVLAACSLMPPTLLLLADGAGARDLGGRVASRLGAAAVCDAYIELEGGNVAVWQGAGESALRVAQGEDDGLEFTVLALVPPGRYEVSIGDEEAEVEMLDLPQPERDFTDLGDGGDWPTVSVLGDGEPATALARALGGTTGPLGAAELRIGIGGGCSRLELFAQDASCRVALGVDPAEAPDVPHAQYALAGAPADLARDLCSAVNARAGAVGQGGGQA